ncbi:MAG: hypothetical protein NWS53_09015 [Salibacteraceae bacterium]|nr:hypothetical protein [Salibacteraceae bacterium]
MNFKIILQARANSTRLPGKMMRDFFRGQTIPELIIENLKRYFSLEDIVLATTSHPNDDELANLALRHGILLFRGDEQDVLKRFIDAAEATQTEIVVRVCADNPFLQVDAIVELLNAFENSKSDYLSFKLDENTPIIKSHLGLFAEVTSLSALKKVAVLSDERFFHEHVTNYIYGHDQVFDVKWLTLPSYLGNRKDIRLTIDTLEDFELCQEIYREIEPDCSAQNILNAIDLNPARLERMKDQIIKNSK